VAATEEAIVNQERRTWPRSEARAQVFVVPADASAPIAYRARNLSAGGVLLCEGPSLHAGRELKLLLPLHGRELVLHARVLRIEKDPLGAPCAAVGFRAVPTFVQDLIQQAVQHSLAQQPTPAAMPKFAPAGTFDEPDQGSTPLRYPSQRPATTSAGSPRKASA
jgi:PilZ domain